MPIRYPAVALLCVDSEDGYRFDRDGYRVDTNQPNRIYINRQRPLAFGYMTRVALTEFNIQWDTPNVNGYNNTFTIFIQNEVEESLSANVLITIPVGFYKPSELATAIQSALNTNAQIITTLNVTSGGLPFTVTVNPNTLRMTIAKTSPVANFDNFGFNLVPPPNGTQNLLNVIGLVPFSEQIPSQTFDSIQGGLSLIHI